MGKHDWDRDLSFVELMFDVEGGKAARDEGMAAAVEHAGPEWGEAVDDRVRQLYAGWEGTTEDIRVLTCRDLPCPGHLNAWGGKTTGWRNRGWLEEIGKAWAQTKAGHRRRVVKYRRTGLS